MTVKEGTLEISPQHISHKTQVVEKELAELILHLGPICPIVICNMAKLLG